MELTVTNRSRAYPGRSSEDSKVDEVQYVVLKVCYLCTSGSVVEYRLAKARVAGSNPVSCSSLRSGIIVNSMVPIFCVQRKVYTNVYRKTGKIKRPCGLEFFRGSGDSFEPPKVL